MAYIHSGKAPIQLKQDPADPDGSDWVFFSYTSWLRDGETITDHSGIVINGELVTDSTYVGTIQDEAGVTHNDVYGVQFKPDAKASEVTVTHRKSTTTSGLALPRLNIDHSAVMKVKSL